MCTSANMHSNVCWCWCLQGLREVVYLCDNIVSEACLAEKQPDACVNELIDSIMAQKATKPGLSGTLLAAIIVPVVVVGACSCPGYPKQHAHILPCQRCHSLH